MTRRDTSSAWDRLPLDRAGPSPLYLQLRDAVLGAVRAGRLAPGARLPSVRGLAGRLRLNVNTVARAYRLLEEAGAVETHAAKGTFVARSPAPPPQAALPPPRPARVIPAVSPDVLRGGAGGARGQQAACLTPAAGVVPLAGGTPSPDLFPFAEIRRLIDAVLDEEGPVTFQYGGGDGLPSLRAAAAEVLRASGIAVGPEDLVVTTGAQQGIDLVARALLAPGDAVVVEAPTYPGALESFERAGCRLLTLPMTPNGPDIAALPAMLERARPRLLYTVPTFHNPTGWTMDGETREALLAAAARAGTLVLEDDHAADLRFEGQALLSLKALDRANLVVHVRGFAKTILPGLRLGVVAAPSALQARVLALKLAADLYAPPLEQRVLARFLAGGYAAHLDRIRGAYRARRDHALARLSGPAAAGLAIVPPAGGLNLWIGLPAGVSADALEREALATGVAVTPGGLFYPERREGDGFVRLSYGSVPEEALDRGLGCFLAAVDRVRRAGAPAVTAGAMPLV